MLNGKGIIKMSTYNSLLIITLFIFMPILAMDTEKQPQSDVTSLCTTLMHLPATNYKGNAFERRKNKAEVIMALQKGYENGTLAIEKKSIDACKNIFVGKHGWTMDTGNGKTCVYTTHGDFKYKIRITRSLALEAMFLIKQKNEKDKYITSNGNDIHIITMQSGTQTILSGHTDLVHCCTNTDHADIILSGSNSTVIRIWDTKANKCLETLHGHEKYVTHIASEKDIFLSADWTPLLKIWDLSSGKCQSTKSIDSSPLSFMMNNSMTYIGLVDGKIIIIDPRCNKSTHEWTAHERPVSCLIPCKYNNTLIYSGSWDQTIKQWDLRNLSAYTKKLHKKHDVSDAIYNIQNLHEDHKGKKIFSSDLCGIQVWDVVGDKPKLITTIELDKRITSNCMEMNDDETELYIGTKDGIKTIASSFTFEELYELITQK